MIEKQRSDRLERNSRVMRHEAKGVPKRGTVRLGTPGFRRMMGVQSDLDNPTAEWRNTCTTDP